MEVVYNGQGEKLAVKFYDGVTGAVSSQIFYNGSFTYSKDGTAAMSLRDMQTPEGVVVKTATGYTYRYFMRDYLNSVRHVSGIEQLTDYDPLGQILVYRNQNLQDNTYLYESKELYTDFSSAYMGVYDFGARYYNPLYGRWFAPDPAKQGINPYMYCANNPVMLVDPDGKRWFEWQFRLLIQSLNMAKERVLKDDDYNMSFNIVSNREQYTEEQYNAAKKKYDDYRKRLGLIDQDEENIKRMHADKEHLYILGPIEEGPSYILQGKKDKVIIQYTSEGGFAHERSHVIQWLDSGLEFEFEDRKLLNVGYYSSQQPRQRVDAMIMNEVDAYKMQYAYDGAYILLGINGNININSLEDITPNTISNILNRETGTVFYQYTEMNR